MIDQNNEGQTEAEQAEDSGATGPTGALYPFSDFCLVWVTNQKKPFIVETYSQAVTLAKKAAMQNPGQLAVVLNTSVEEAFYVEEPKRVFRFEIPEILRRIERQKNPSVSD